MNAASRYSLFLAVLTITLFGKVAFGSTPLDNIALRDKAENLFYRAAEIDGSAYVLARTQLELFVDSILPLLRDKSASKNWREQFLAQLLISRIEKPSEHAHFRSCLKDYRCKIVSQNKDLEYQISDSAVRDSAEKGILLEH